MPCLPRQEGERMMKKIDKDKDYTCRFDGEYGESGLFVHIHCLLVPYSQEEIAALKEKGIFEDAVNRKLFTAYQYLTLYDRIKNFGCVASGSWLLQLKDLDAWALRYIDWTPVS